jgi:hypothetical protein
MSQCPVCKTKYNEQADRKHQNCEKCKWCLIPSDRDFSFFRGQQIPETYKIQVEDWARSSWQRVEDSEQDKREAIEYRYKYENLLETVIGRNLHSLEHKHNTLQTEVQQLRQQLSLILKERENINQFQTEIKKENAKQLKEAETRLLKTANAKFKVNDLSISSDLEDKLQSVITNTSIEQNRATELKTDSKINLTDEEREIVKRYTSELDLTNLFNISSVSPTKDSINQRRGGTNTINFEVDTRNGNYWVITGENSQYLVPKYNLRITTHILNSLVDFFQSDNEIKTEEIDSFILKKPGIVDQQASQWQLIAPGSLEFISNREGGGSESQK